SGMGRAVVTGWIYSRSAARNVRKLSMPRPHSLAAPHSSAPLAVRRIDAAASDSDARSYLLAPVGWDAATRPELHKMCQVSCFAYALVDNRARVDAATLRRPQRIVGS